MIMKQCVRGIFYWFMMPYFLLPFLNFYNDLFDLLLVEPCPSSHVYIRMDTALTYVYNPVVITHQAYDFILLSLLSKTAFPLGQWIMADNGTGFNLFIYFQIDATLNFC